MAARSVEKATSTIAELKEQTGREARFIQIDLANLASIKKAANDFLSKERQLHVLFNNACVRDRPLSCLELIFRM